MYKLGDSHHTLSMHCGRYIRITSKNNQVFLSKKDWAFLMELASACINRQVIRFSRLQDGLVECWNKCLQERSFSTPPNANGINFDSFLMNYVIKHVFSTKIIQIRMLKLFSCVYKRVHVSTRLNLVYNYFCLFINA